MCRNEGVGVIPWSPLRGGWLSGRYRRGMTGPPKGSRVEAAEEKNWGERFAVYDNERTWSVIDEVIAVADQAGRSPAQVSLRWLLERPGITAPIIGARSMPQLEDNLGALGWSLSEEQAQRLTKVSEPPQPLPYPYDSINDPSRAR